MSLHETTHLQETTLDPSQLEGRTLSCSSQTIRYFSELLGLNSPASRYKIRAMAWVGSRIDISIVSDSKSEFVLTLQRSAPNISGFYTSEFLTIFYRGQDLPKDLAEILDRNIRKNLSGYSLEKLAEVLCRDPELGKPGLPKPPDIDQTNHPESLLNTWGGENAYADFFAGGEIARGQLDSLDLFNRCTFIQHSDIECLTVTPNTGVPMVNMINYPWDDRLRLIGNKNRNFSLQLPTITIENNPLTTTDLTEKDVIMGNPEKLIKATEHVIAKTKKNMIFFSCTCTPMVTGEDVESVVKRYQSKSSVPLVYLTVTPQSMMGVFRDLLVTKRLEAEKRAGEPRPNSVNLIGFPRDSTTEELVEVLREIGIETINIFIPSIETEAIERLPEAVLNVFFPNTLWQNHYDQLLFNTKIRHISPPSPFGFAKTKRWLEAVAAEFGLEDRVQSVWANYSAKYEKKWSELTSEARKYWLGFIIRTEESFFLTDPAQTWGVPLIEFLSEAGFGIEVLLKAHDAKSAHKAATEIHAMFSNPSATSIKGFNSFEMMVKRLNDSRSSAFFSHHFFDWRLTQTGKSSFSLQHFEKGLSGALRTLERLLTICRSRFYKRYKDYLKRTPDGLYIEI